MKNEFVYRVSFDYDKWKDMTGLYTSLHNAMEAVKTYIYDNNARLLQKFSILECRNDYESYIAYGQTLFKQPFSVYIEKIQIDTPIEEA